MKKAIAMKWILLACLCFGMVSFAQTPDVVPEARFKGNFGARFEVGSGDETLVDASPEAEVNYHARFYLYVDDLDMAGTNQFTLFAGRDIGGTAHFELFVVGNAGGHEAAARARLDNGTFSPTAMVALTRGWQALEVIWSAGAGTGSLTLVKDGTPSPPVENLDNDQAVIDNVRLGTFDETGVGNNGTFDVDDFSARKLSNPSLLCLSEAEFLGFIAEWPARNLLQEMDLLNLRCQD